MSKAAGVKDKSSKSSRGPARPKVRIFKGSTPEHHRGGSPKFAHFDPLLEVTPTLLADILGYFDAAKVRTSGLFRQSGNVGVAKALLARYEKGKRVDLSKFEAHTVGSLLTLFLRTLENPLLTFELYDCFLAAVQAVEPDQQRGRLRQCLVLLPPGSLHYLSKLVGFLVVVDAAHEDNKMDAKNLAIVFAPILLRPPPEEDNLGLLLGATVHSNKIIEHFILAYEEMFLRSFDDAHAGVQAALGHAAPRDGLSDAERTDFLKRMRRGTVRVAESMVKSEMAKRDKQEQLPEESEDGDDFDLERMLEREKRGDDHSPPAPDERNVRFRQPPSPRRREPDAAPPPIPATYDADAPQPRRALTRELSREDEPLPLLPRRAQSKDLRPARELSVRVEPPPREVVGNRERENLREKEKEKERKIGLVNKTRKAASFIGKAEDAEEEGGAAPPPLPERTNLTSGSMSLDEYDPSQPPPLPPRNDELVADVLRGDLRRLSVALRSGRKDDSSDLLMMLRAKLREEGL